MKISFDNTQKFGAKIIYNDETRYMKALLNSTSGTKNIDVFGALVESINKMLPSKNDEFMFTGIAQNENNPKYYNWSGKLVHNGKESKFISEIPYIAYINFPENCIKEILLDILKAAYSLYQINEGKPKLVLPDLSKFKIKN